MEITEVTMTDYERRLTRWVRENVTEDAYYKSFVLPDDVVVTEINPTTIFMGYCETCSYTDEGFEIVYKYEDGRTASIDINEYKFELGRVLREMMSYEFD